VRISKISAFAAASAVLIALAACSGPSVGGSGGDGTAKADTSTKSNPVDTSTCTNKIQDPKAPVVTLWSWSPTAQVAVDEFNAAHRDVQICWTNAGAGADEYNKFSTAIAAGKGAPDVVMLETEVLTSFEIKNALVDLAPYDTKGELKKAFGAGTLKDISQGGDVYAVPDDGGPVAFMYRKDIFDKYGLTVPKTWDEYAADAQKLKDAGGPLIGDWPADTPAFTQAMFNQKGAKTFDYRLADKTKLGIDVDNAPSEQVLQFWQGLVDKKLVSTAGQSTTDFTSALVGGQLATMIAPSWEPGHLVSAGIKPGADSPWRVAPLPQWKSGDAVQVNWGGSTYAVTSQAVSKKLAAEVAIGIFAHETPTTIGAHFPLHLEAQKSDWFKNANDPFFGNQAANKEVWIPAAAGYKGAVYSPFQPYYEAQLIQALGKVIPGDQTPKQALSALQKDTKSYAQKQGFQVK
jgi:multiple sugar transport system substrate-binding protein